MRQVYLDYNASTPLAPEVAAAMEPFIRGSYGNPSSGHWASSEAKLTLGMAREQVARALGCASGEIVFASSGTEASNLALKGAFFAHWGQPFHVITSAIEHAATMAPCRFLQSLGAELTVLPVDGCGLVDPEALRRALRPHTALVSIMHANNEVGTIQPISAIAAICREAGALLHVDAAQSMGKIPVDVAELGVDLLSITAQKIYGPKGVGALFIRDGVRLVPLLHGPDAHEGGRRAGTESAMLAAALGAACSLAVERRERDAVSQSSLRDNFYWGLCDVFGDRLRLNGHPTKRLPNTLNVSILGWSGGELLAALGGVAASTGSACHSGSTALSPTLAAMGVEPVWGRGAIRFSLGRGTTREDIDYTLQRLHMAASPSVKR